MLAYIKAKYKTGDTIEVTSSQGVFSGAIEYVTDQYIVLRQPNGQICGIAATDIRTFRAESPVAPAPQQISVTQIPAERTEESVTMDAPTVAAEEEKEDSQDAVVSTAEVSSPIVEPKVVGHIDLDKLKRIDPKFSQRKYFKSGDENMAEEKSGHVEEETDQTNAAPYADNYQRQPYVSAKGRITYYNNDKRYGFIHDYLTDNDLYFNLTQVADYDLYDHLHKGTKVAYTMDRNAQGFTARCVHLPHTIAELLEIAEDYLDSRHYYLAQGLAEHVLEVSPENKDAKEILDEIHNAAPASRFMPSASAPTPNQYNPCALYSQAKKAYLSKDYAKAEELYVKAIEAGERPESCVKDLVTLYVSRFKQATDANEREESRRKAVDFLESHRQMLADNLTTKQFLALNYYLPILDYTNFIHTVDEILTDPQVTDVLSRRVFYIWQKGIALNKMGRTQEALEQVDEGLELAPRSRQLLNLRNLILHPEYQANFATSEVPAESGSQPEGGLETIGGKASADEQPSEAPATPQVPTTENPSLSEDVSSDDGGATGEQKPDSWWDSLKKGF